MLDRESLNLCQLLGCRYSEMNCFTSSNRIARRTGGKALLALRTVANKVARCGYRRSRRFPFRYDRGRRRRDGERLRDTISSVDTHQNLNLCATETPHIEYSPQQSARTVVRITSQPRNAHHVPRHRARSVVTATSTRTRMHDARISERPAR